MQGYTECCHGMRSYEVVWLVVMLSPMFGLEWHGGLDLYLTALCPH